MSKIEAASDWDAWAESRKGRWKIDNIHNGLEGRDFLVYCPVPGGEAKGSYVRVVAGQPMNAVEFGTYRDACPDIGGAMFFPVRTDPILGDMQEVVTEVFEAFAINAERDGLCA